MSDVVNGLKSLSLHGMASAWPEVLGTARIKALDHEVVLHQLDQVRSCAARGPFHGLSNAHCPLPRAPGFDGV